MFPVQPSAADRGCDRVRIACVLRVAQTLQGRQSRIGDEWPPMPEDEYWTGWRSGYERSDAVLNATSG